MYKKIISVMSVILVVFLCFNYDVKADEVIDSSRRYNWLSTTQHYGNVDVTGNLFCLSDNPAMQSVNLSSAEYVGGGTTQSVVSTWESVYLWKFQATYVLKNNGDTYETFDNGRLYSQFSVNAKASTSSSGSGSLTDDVVPSGWYIDNINGATLTNALSDGTMYWSVDHTYYGNTLIIAPGESITFSYDINIFWWEQSFGVGGTTFACNNGSISNTIGYTQQDGYNSYSVYEFITDYPFPSVDQYVADNITNIYSLTNRIAAQGVITNNELSDIYNVLTTHAVLDNSYTLSGYSTIRSNTTQSGNNVNRNTNVFTTHPYIVDRQFSNIYGYTDYDVIVCVPYYRRYSLNNTLSDTTLISASDYSRCYNPLTITSNYNYLGSKVEFLDYVGMVPTGITDEYRYWFAPTDTKYFILEPNESVYCLWVEYLYFGYSGSTVPAFTFNISSPIVTDPSTFTTYSNDFISQNNTTQNTESQVHSTEQNYYAQGNTALGNTGIDNYSFSQEQSGGITGVSNDFVRVWNACGSLNSVWVFSLTLSLALYIVHHVPKQRS